MNDWDHQIHGGCDRFDLANRRGLMRRLFLSTLVFAVVTACAPAQHLRGTAITQHYRIQLNPNLTPELQKKTFWTSTAQSVAVTTVEGVPPGELTDPKSVVSHPL